METNDMVMHGNYKAKASLDNRDSQCRIEGT